MTVKPDVWGTTSQFSNIERGFTDGVVEVDNVAWALASMGQFNERRSPPTQLGHLQW